MKSAKEAGRDMHYEELANTVNYLKTSNDGEHGCLFSS